MLRCQQYINLVIHLDQMAAIFYNLDKIILFIHLYNLVTRIKYSWCKNISSLMLIILYLKLTETWNCWVIRGLLLVGSWACIVGPGMAHCHWLVWALRLGSWWALIVLFKTARTKNRKPNRTNIQFLGNKPPNFLS